MTRHIKPNRFDGYLTIEDVCKLLGKPYDVSTRILVWRLLRSREKRSGQQIVFQRVPGGRCYTTLSVLKNTFPEWYDYRDHMAEMLREKLDKFEERCKRLELLNRALGARLRKVEKACRKHGVEW